ncbi:MAG: DUF2304 domain-containing protein [Patescibacteria group bacterium]|jgi:hypothetical protein
MIFQALLITFAFFALAKTYRQYAHRKVSLYWSMVWGMLWMILIVVACIPETTDILAQYVGVEKGADLFVYSSIVILFYAIYRVIVRQEKIQRELTELVRQIAIHEAKKK